MVLAGDLEKRIKSPERLGKYNRFVMERSDYCIILNWVGDLIGQ